MLEGADVRQPAGVHTGLQRGQTFANFDQLPLEVKRLFLTWGRIQNGELNGHQQIPMLEQVCCLHDRLCNGLLSFLQLLPQGDHTLVGDKELLFLLLHVLFRTTLYRVTPGHHLLHLLLAARQALALRYLHLGLFFLQGFKGAICLLELQLQALGPLVHGTTCSRLLSKAVRNPLQLALGLLELRACVVQLVGQLLAFLLCLPQRRFHAFLLLLDAFDLLLQQRHLLL
mmetsp:Transcript_62841/g.103683  ORF Transcript_62841/g.103683 Transcript_62841/m.103683 type:complete len:228 (-) Transcript_62841:1352-2035(-)